MSAPADQSSTATETATATTRQLDVMVVDQWLIFDCPNCSQTIKLDRKDSVHNIECPACESGFEPLLDRDVRLPPRKVTTRRRRRRGPRNAGNNGEDAASASDAPRKRQSAGPSSRPTASSLPSEGVVKLALTPAAPTEEDVVEEDKSPLSRLPVRSALELERRRVEALDTKQAQPDEKELNAVIEEQSGGKYKRIRVRTRKKRLTEKQRLTKLILTGGLIAIVVIALSLWGASQMFQRDDDVGVGSTGSRSLTFADSEPIGAPIGNKNQLLANLLQAEDVDVLLKLIRNPKRLEPAVRAFYGGNTLPKLVARDIQPVSGNKSSLPKNFIQLQMILSDRSIPVYIEKTETHGYRLDWESFVGYGTMPWEEFISSRATKTVRMRVHLSDAKYYDVPFTRERFRCLRIEDPKREHMVYGYYPRNDMKFVRLAERIFEETSSSRFPGDIENKGFDMAVMLDIRYRPGASSPYQVEIVDFVTDSWLRP